MGALSRRIGQAPDSRVMSPYVQQEWELSRRRRRSDEPLLSTDAARSALSRDNTVGWHGKRFIVS